MRFAIRRCLEHAARTSRWSSTLADVESKTAADLGASACTGKLEELSRSFHILPPVSFLDEATAPTALQWLRRRGPPMSEGSRRKLVRQRRMRLLSHDNSELRRVSQSALLPQGARLLVPRDSPAARNSQEPNDHAHPPESNAGFAPKHIRQLEAKLVEHMQRRVLHLDAELLVLDKPAGLPMQGGDRIHVSLDSLLPHLRFGCADTPRLVHRLDRNTSGALVVARTADAAAWLSQAFRLPAQGLSAGQPLPPVRGVPFVEKHYQAVVEDVAGLRDRGSISARLLGQGGSATGRAAVTNYEVLARSAEGFAWLALQPITGRKHQLRQVCAEMGAPIVGDGRYGRTRSPAQQRLAQLLREAPLPDQAAPDQDAHEAELDRLLRCDSHLLLHCCRIVIQRSASELIDVVAPPSQHMQRVLDVLFRNIRDTLPGGRISSSRAGPISSMPSSRGFSSGVGNSRCSDGRSTWQLFGAAHPQEHSTTAGPCCTAVTSVQMLVSLRRCGSDAGNGAVKGSGTGMSETTDVSSKRAEHSGSAGAATLLLTDTKPGPRPPPLEIEPEEGMKPRWSWAQKRAAKIERQKDAEMRKLKKKRKEARKHRKGRQRSIRRHTGHEYVGVALDAL